MGVFVAAMPNQLSTSHKGHVAVWALVRASTWAVAAKQEDDDIQI